MRLLKTNATIAILVCSAAVMIGGGFWEDRVSAEPKPRLADQQTEPESGVRTFMRKKLAHSQNLLEALVLDDFATIKKEARQLGMLSQAVEWQVLRTEEYLEHSRDFRRAADSLVAAAEEENSDGSALAYMEMTMRCVRCHKYVRDIKMASLSPAESRFRE